MAQKYPNRNRKEEVTQERDGKKKAPRDRKNPSAREQWQKRKQETNAARGKLLQTPTDLGGYVYAHENGEN